ncbi:MAG: efflux RND transporter permease subunit [Balneolaceae bacterium]|nr:MAG: efflux RND transporter permease subunit [Balneolaceae bacterium]
MLLKRPITAIMLVLATFIFGYIALQELSVDLLPDVDVPSLMVRTEWPGASASEVETRINEQLEAALGTLPGLRRSQSFARQGIGFVSLEFEWGHNMDLAFLNARERLDQVRFSLPQQAERPQLVYSDPGDEPVAILGIQLRDNPDPAYEERLELKQWADRVLTRRLEQEQGIAQAVIVGALTPEVHIRYQPHLADRYGLSTAEIRNRVREANEFSPSGELRDGWYRYSLKIESRITSIEQLRRLPLKTVGGERILRLQDVAEVRMDERDPVSFSMVDGLPVLSVLVKKDFESNLVQVFHQMTPVLEELREQFPGFSIDVLSENATFIEASINNLLQTLLLGGILAFFVLFFFLNDPRSPLTIGIAIPVSIMLTFFVMYLSGIQLNIISLSGLTLGIGLLVDNAIVVLENINRHRKSGLPLFEAAGKGTREISLAVTASTLTTISVFLPLVFLGGFEGAFFRDQALTLSIALLSSLLVALLILPVLVLQVQKFRRRRRLAETGPAASGETEASSATGQSGRRPHPPEITPTDLPEDRSTIFTRGMDRAQARYEKLLLASIRRPVLVVSLFLVAMALAVVAFLYIPKELIPQGEEQRLRYRVTMPGNTALRSTQEAARTFTASIHNVAGMDTFAGGMNPDNVRMSPVDGRVSPDNARMSPVDGRANPDGRGTSQAVGPILTLGGYTDDTNITRLADEGLNRFVIEIPLNDPRAAGLIRSEIETLQQNQPHWRIEELQALPLFENVLGRQAAPVVVHVAGQDRRAGAAGAERLRGMLADRNPDWRLDLQHAEEVETWHLHFRPDRLLRYGITEPEVISFLESAARGAMITEWMQEDENIDIRLYQQVSAHFDPAEMRLPSRGRMVRLSELATIEHVGEPEQIERINQTPVISYLSDIGLAAWWWQRGDFRDVVEAFRMETGVDVHLSGTAIQVESLLRDMARLLLISVILIYVILTVQYENMKYPLIIMLGVPFAWIGSLLVLWPAGLSLNILSFMGILVLTGIAVNDAILKVDFMRRYYADTGNLDEAVHLAGRHRFRPVVMTTMTTLLGLLPMIIPIGDGYEFRQSLALALMGGMVSSTLLTLFLVPMVFRWIERRKDATHINTATS